MVNFMSTSSVMRFSMDWLDKKDFLVVPLSVVTVVWCFVTVMSLVLV